MICITRCGYHYAFTKVNYCKIPKSDSLMEAALETDNLEQLDHFISLQNVSVDTILKKVSESRPPMLWDEPCLLAFAAFYAAEKCFEYLLANGASTNVLDEVLFVLISIDHLFTLLLPVETKRLSVF